MKMPRKKVFLFSPTGKDGETQQIRMLEQAGCEIVLGKASWASPHGNSEEEMCAIAKECYALFGTTSASSIINKKLMQGSDKLRIVAKYGIGVDDIDVEAATELGILVTHGPTESNWGGVVEGTMASMLCLLKKVRERDAHVRKGGWREEGLRGIYLGARGDGYSGITVGIVGLGRVGGRFADFLNPWRVRILAYDPYIPPSQFDAHGAKAVDFHTLLRDSDVLSLHVVLTKETRHMIGAAELSMMKPSAILINTSRGPVIDEKALSSALKEETIAAAALDVFEDEPLLESSPLIQLGDKVLLSPHMVSSNVGVGLRPGIKWATESVLKALKGEVPDNVYNKEVIPRWMERFPKNA